MPFALNNDLADELLEDEFDLDVQLKPVRDDDPGIAHLSNTGGCQCTYSQWDTCGGGGGVGSSRLCGICAL
jgi:hypothetical protein